MERIAGDATKRVCAFGGISEDDTLERGDKAYSHYTSVERK